MSPSMPSHDVGSLAEKSPRVTARSALKSCRLTCSDPAAPFRGAAAPFFAAAVAFLGAGFVLPATAAGGIRRPLGRNERTPSAPYLKIDRQRRRRAFGGTATPRGDAPKRRPAVHN